MDARFSLGRLVVVLFCIAICVTRATAGSGFRTANFSVDAPTPQLAREIGVTAERLRKELAQEWLGKELPRWAKPCPIKARVAPNLGAGGATSFVFDRSEVFGWRMEIQGSRARILDSVLPHEITHTIFACHFRQPLPRWADEGACTTVEHVSEISKQERMLIDFLQTRRGIPFDAMFAMKEYPQDVMPLYAQGHSLSRYLIGLRGKRDFLAFLEDGLQDENWRRAMEKWYGYRDLATLQNTWLSWIKQGRPDVQLASRARQGLAASPGSSMDPTASGLVVRGQDPGSSRPATKPAGESQPTSPSAARVGSHPWQVANQPRTDELASQVGMQQSWPGKKQVAQAADQLSRETVYEALSKHTLRQ